MEESVSKDELLRFSERVIKPIIIPLLKGNHPMSLIQTRFAYLRHMIMQRHRQYPLINEVTERYKDAVQEKREVPFGFSGYEGPLLINFFLPVVWEVYQRILNHNGPDLGGKIFKTWILICFMHENEHAAFNPLVRPTTLDGWMGCERVAWAYTCEHTIHPLFFTYSMPIAHDNGDHYKKWVSCGRNVNNPEWSAYIYTLHGTIYRPAMESIASSTNPFSNNQIILE